MSATFRPGGTQFVFIPYVPESGPDQPIKFRAHITNISDSSSPSWGEHNDMGRGDPKVMYNGYSRTITVDFMTVALYRDEEQFWLDTLNSLTEMTKPVYKPGKGFNGVYTKLVIGKFIDEIGYITSVDISTDNETPWVKDKPIYITCSVSMRVLGNKKPSYRQYKGGLGNKGFNFGKDR